MKQIPLREILHRPLENLLLFSVFFVALPHAFHLDLPVFAFFAGLVLWRFAAGTRPNWQPGRGLLFFVSLAGAFLVYSQYHRFYGREGGGALLVVALGLKMLEMKTRREVYLVVYLEFFVALTQYLFAETIPLALYTLVAVGLAVTVLIGANGGAALPLREIGRRSAGLVAQALPVMVVLFIFVPRIPGPLWKLPDEGRRAKTGLSEIIEPGSVSALGQSSELAFRVDFEGVPPPRTKFYWRGPVFWHTDGTRWTLSSEKHSERPPEPEYGGQEYRYLVTLEPHRQRWVFALELPVKFPRELSKTWEYLLLAKEKLADRRQYAMVSRLSFRTGSLDPMETRLGLQLPGEADSRIRKLVEGWQAAATEPKDIVRQALAHFHDEPFVYTLHPPITPDHPVERFLFDTRRGFCEHYATAFVVLMRVAGIPARVVTGYQGGLWNPLGRFLEVRQADAHAWAEVWLPGQGWTRVDPTAAVAPERIEHGVDLDQQTAAGEVRFNLGYEGSGGGVLGIGGWLKDARLAWSSIDHTWNLWVLSYDPDRQKRFWESLGIVDWRGVVLWLSGLLGLCSLTVTAIALWPRRRTAKDPAVRDYQRFLTTLARHGSAKAPGEGPVDFARRAGARHPGAAADIQRITALFLGLHYGRQPNASDRGRLRRLVREFRI